MSTPRTVPIVCAKAPRYIVWVPAFQYASRATVWLARITGEPEPWFCSWCGARVRVVA